MIPTLEHCHQREGGGEERKEGVREGGRKGEGGQGREGGRNMVSVFHKHLPFDQTCILQNDSLFEFVHNTLM